MPREQTPWRELRLRTGDRLVLVDVAAGGALVESSRRLLPGTAVMVHLISPARVVSLRAVVVWCCVAELSPQAGVKYRGGFSFTDDPQEYAIDGGDMSAFRR